MDRADMSDATIKHLAHSAGPATEWVDYRGPLRTVLLDALRAVLRTMNMPLQSEVEREKDRSRLRSAPRRGAGATGRRPLNLCPDRIIDSRIGFMAATARQFVIVPVEDVARLEESHNLPGTIDQRANGVASTLGGCVGQR
jgi:hypothetical protein